MKMLMDIINYETLKVICRYLTILLLLVASPSTHMNKEQGPMEDARYDASCF